MFADVVLTYSAGNEIRSCGEGLPVCEAGEPEPCGPQEVLGPPDGVGFVLGPGAHIDLGFRCRPATERGGQDSPDITIWATIPETPDAGVATSGIVMVTEDGIQYDVWVELEESNQGLDLARIGRTYVSYLRIVNQGPAALTLDAVEAL
jgi:hypothetical protein